MYIVYAKVYRPSVWIYCIYSLRIRFDPRMERSIGTICWPIHSYSYNFCIYNLYWLTTPAIEKKI